MEQFLSRFLHATPRYPAWIRYLLTCAIVTLTAAGDILFDRQLDAFPFLLFIPSIFLVSVIFDRGSGFLATFASAAIVSTYMQRPVNETAIPLLIFLAIGLMIAALTETLRRASERLAEAKAHSDLLLQELYHRTKNDLSTVISVLRLQARTTREPTAQAALTSAIDRVQVIARVHDRLRDTRDNQEIPIAPYIEELCRELADFHRGVRPIAVRVSCEDISLKSSQAAAAGLIVNELVTNAFKYAFPDGRTGAIEVKVQSTESHLTIRVRDDGVGCPDEMNDGLGTALIKLLSAQMNGSMKRVSLPEGCQVEVVVARDG